MTATPVTLNIAPEYLVALARFAETCSDGEGYDVRTEDMQAMARLGLVRRVTASIYEITQFGEAALDAIESPVLPVGPMSEHDIIELFSKTTAEGQGGYMVAVVRQVEARYCAPQVTEN